jgi:hypothetical protein
MRKLLLTLAMIGGAALMGTAPASANVAAGIAPKPAVADTANKADQVRYRRHRGGFYFGYGAPYWGPRYGYYNRPYRRWGHRRHFGSRYGYYRPYRRHWY